MSIEQSMSVLNARSNANFSGVREDAITQTSQCDCATEISTVKQDAFTSASCYVSLVIQLLPYLLEIHSQRSQAPQIAPIDLSRMIRRTWFALHDFLILCRYAVREVNDFKLDVGIGFLFASVLGFRGMFMVANHWPAFAVHVCIPAIVYHEQAAGIEAISGQVPDDVVKSCDFLQDSWNVLKSLCVSDAIEEESGKRASKLIPGFDITPKVLVLEEIVLLANVVHLHPANANA